MSLQGIIAVSGLPGLYKVLAQTKSGFIVESLLDNKRSPVSSSERISMLEDISVFTISEDLPLKDVFKKIKENDNADFIPSPKSANKVLLEFFKSVLPDFDEERVYPSDIKKIISWYHLVKDNLDEDDTEQEVNENVNDIDDNQVNDSTDSAQNN